MNYLTPELDAALRRLGLTKDRGYASLGSNWTTAGLIHYWLSQPVPDFQTLRTCYGPVQANRSMANRLADAFAGVCERVCQEYQQEAAGWNCAATAIETYFADHGVPLVSTRNGIPDPRPQRTGRWSKDGTWIPAE